MAAAAAWTHTCEEFIRRSPPPLQHDIIFFTSLLADTGRTDDDGVRQEQTAEQERRPGG